MGESVKPRRRYDSPRRREQAAATRRDILDAARLLFERDGYAASSMASIAAEAGVALKTVYLAFDTKAGLLRTLWHLLLRGDETDAPVGAREWFGEVLDEPDPERALRLNVHNARRVRARASALLRAIHDAAAADPEVAELWGRIQAEFYDNQRAVIEALHSRGSLRPGLDPARATDILWTLNSPALYWLLVDDRGWTPEQHESWLGDTLCSQLLPDPERRRRPSSR
jgi:AcrR family transcriptional regulator